MSTPESIKRRKKPKRDEPLYLPTGSTVMDLALTGDFGGIAVGTMVNSVGDSSAGKTLKALTTLAEAAHNPAFDEYELIHHDAESRSRFDIRGMFGKKTAKRIRVLNDKTVEGFEANAKKYLQSPCIYVLDSWEALTSEAELRLVEEQIKAREAGRKVPESYGMEKAKAASRIFRQVCSDIEKSKSILMIISQVRTKIDAGMFESNKTRTAENALEFYATYVWWLAVAKTVTKEYKRKKRTIGHNVRIKITKNSQTGLVHTITEPIYKSYGVDDVRGCIEYLLDENHWKKSGQAIAAKEFDVKLNMAGLIDHIEENDLEPKLREIVRDVWQDIAEALRPKRKKRYQ